MDLELLLIESPVRKSSSAKAMNTKIDMEDARDASHIID
jgi:hypothetical protein